MWEHPKMDVALNTTCLKKLKNVGTKIAPHLIFKYNFCEMFKKLFFSTFVIFVVGLAYEGKDIVSRFILMYSSRLRDFVP